MSCELGSWYSFFSKKTFSLNLSSTGKWLNSSPDSRTQVTPSILATWCEEPTHRKRPWCWERLKAGGKGDDRGWDDWMAPPTRWTWIWVSSGSWWWTGSPGVLQSMGSQRVRYDWALNWIEEEHNSRESLQKFIEPHPKGWKFKGREL